MSGGMNKFQTLGTPWRMVTYHCFASIVCVVFIILFAQLINVQKLLALLSVAV